MDDISSNEEFYRDLMIRFMCRLRSIAQGFSDKDFDSMDVIDELISNPKKLHTATCLNVEEGYEGIVFTDEETFLQVEFNDVSDKFSWNGKGYIDVDPLTMKKDGDCWWEYDSTHYKWDTRCGKFFQFTGDGYKPQEHGFEYCPYCGEEIVVEVEEDN
jgi:hypothetical protein